MHLSPLRKCIPRPLWQSAIIKIKVPDNHTKQAYTFSHKVRKMETLRAIVRPILRAITRNRVLRTITRWFTLRGLVPHFIWTTLPVELTFEVEVTPEVSFHYCAAYGDRIGQELFWRGGQAWEGETLQVFIQLAQKARLVLDIGANTGFFAMLTCAANSDVEVIAFEPVPRVYERLVENIAINHWEDRCQTKGEAVSNVEGKATFHVPFTFIPWSGSLKAKGFRGLAGELIEVPVTTIDALLGDRAVDLIKIDVEGFEDTVLEGMLHTLSGSTPTIVVECTLDGPYERVEAILSEYNYRFYHLKPGELVEADHIQPDPDDRYRNFLCTIREYV
jgi:FkbM family methyltransferase